MSNQRSLKNDLKFGLEKEEPVRQLLKKTFSDEEDIINTKDLYNDEFCKFDYVGITTKKRYEVKSRRNAKYDYSTTLLPVHKITYNTTKNGLIIIFNFTDKCSYITYNQELFKTFSTKDVKVFRDGKWEGPVPHYLIPVNILTDIN